MKKLCSILLCAMLLFAAPIQCFAATSDAKSVTASNAKITYFADGSYATTTLVIPKSASLKATSLLLSSTSRSCQKIYNYYNSSKQLQWTFTLYATFSYFPGMGSTATSASYSYSIVNSEWSLNHASCSRSGSTASANAVFDDKVFFITVGSINADVSLFCDKYGNIS